MSNKSNVTTIYATEGLREEIEQELMGDILDHGAKSISVGYKGRVTWGEADVRCPYIPMSLIRMFEREDKLKMIVEQLKRR